MKFRVHFLLPGGDEYSQDIDAETPRSAETRCRALYPRCRITKTKVLREKA